MKAIGGYFELELQGGEHYHKNAFRLNTARNCLEYILKVRKYKKIYIPYYTCEVILQPIKKCNIDYEFYSINENLEPEKNILLSADEAFLYTNYYGLKQTIVKKLFEVYGNQLIVDNSQAFFAPRIEDVDTFYSPRKFFGISDGAYLYIDKELEENIEQDISYGRMSHLLKRADISPEFGYDDFQKNDSSLDNQPIKMMSNLTEKILCSIDYEQVEKTRKNLYKRIDDRLREQNLLKIELADEDVPMVYPFLIENGEQLRESLIEQRIFIPTYWNNVLEWTNNEREIFLVRNLLALPICQDEILKREIIWKK